MRAMTVLCILSLSVAACGGGGGNTCEKASDLYFDAMRANCTDYSDCCLCICVSQGQVPLSEDPECSCEPLVVPECTGDALLSSQDCLADETACRQMAADQVESACAKNPCDQASDLMIDAMDGFCQGEDDDCLFCECWNQDQVVNEAGDGCEEPDPVDPVVCEGDTLAAAEDCLADENACRQQMEDLALLVCQSYHMGDPCDDDEDCLYEMVCEVNGCMMP
ncbi:MAG: hypothetical protein JXR96_23030 [Deltaproteobacteria bacterium]|nr:hypothetical protein [Deltaproteobacteria bacterium]